MRSKSKEFPGNGEEVGDVEEALLIKKELICKIKKNNECNLTYNELRKGTGWFAKYSVKLRAIFGIVGNKLV
jgi:hypothetical protein